MTMYVGDHAVGSSVDAPSRCLCRFEDGQVFAYLARGNEFVRVRDHAVWALEHDEVLLSARSGEPLAYRRGRVYFGSESGEPLYYERAY